MRTFVFIGKVGLVKRKEKKGDINSVDILNCHDFTSE